VQERFQKLREAGNEKKLSFKEKVQKPESADGVISKSPCQTHSPKNGLEKRPSATNPGIWNVSPFKLASEAGTQGASSSSGGSPKSLHHSRRLFLDEGNDLSCKLMRGKNRKIGENSVFSAQLEIINFYQFYLQIAVMAEG